MDKELRKAKSKAARRILLLVLLVVAIGLGVSMAWAYVERYNNVMRYAETQPIRTMLADAVEHTKTDAPVDPKTGDIYFPTAKLYLPNSSSYVELMYTKDIATALELSIANKATMRQSFQYLYNARDFHDVFAQLPYIQACQRGVSVLYEKSTNDQLELRHTVRLNNGKTVYLYIEKACPQLADTAGLLKGLRAY